MSIIQINNKGINVLEMNSEASQTIVMVHGMFTNMSVFYFNIAPELAKDYHIVLYDLSSHGMSERVEQGYSLEAMSHDLIALLDTLNLSKVHLVGYSYGGLIALKTALTNPVRIDKLVVIESPKPDQGNNPELLKKYGNEYIDHYVTNYAKSTLVKPGKRHIEKNKKLLDFLLNQTTIKEDIYANIDFFEELSQNTISHKTLLLYGLSSDCQEAASILNHTIPDSLLLKGEGDHNIPVQNPQWISSKLIEFMSNG